jgi:predicted transcriptional regulator
MNFVSCIIDRDTNVANFNNEGGKLMSAVPDFAFLTNHGKTLLLIARDRRIRMRDIASRLNITERATQRIVGDLAKAGYVDRERDGRRNLYSVRTDAPLGLPIQRDIDIGSLLGILSVHDDPGEKSSES